MLLFSYKISTFLSYAAPCISHSHRHNILRLTKPNLDEETTSLQRLVCEAKEKRKVKENVD